MTSPRSTAFTLATAALVAALTLALVAAACGTKLPGNTNQPSNNQPVGNQNAPAIQPPTNQPTANQASNTGLPAFTPLDDVGARFFSSPEERTQLLAERYKPLLSIVPNLPARETPLPAVKVTPPTSVTLIVRDLMGYSDDCGCSGDAIGGIPRVAGLLPECPLPEPGKPNGRRTFVFIGRLLAPELAGFKGMEFLKAPLIAQLPSRVLVTARMFEALGNAVWVPDQGELDELAKERIAGKPIDLSPLAPFRHDTSKPLLIEGMDAAFEISRDQLYPGTLKLTGVDETGTKPVPTVVTLSGPDDRARNVIVVCRWPGKGTQPGTYMDPVYGDQYRAVRQGPGHVLENSAFLRLSQVLDKREGPYAGHWRETIAKGVSPDPILKMVVDKAEFEAGHADIPHGMQIADQVPLMLNEWQKRCQSCHQSAYDTWSKSRHTKAFQTLFNVKKNTDARCVGCHTQQVLTHPDGKVDTYPEWRGVTCMTCHDRGKPVKEVCTTCHTKLADPEQHYLKALATICSGSKDKLVAAKSGNPCSRATPFRELPKKAD